MRIQDESIRKRAREAVTHMGDVFYDADAFHDTERTNESIVEDATECVADAIRKALRDATQDLYVITEYESATGYTKHMLGVTDDLDDAKALAHDEWSTRQAAQGGRHIDRIEWAPKDDHHFALGYPLRIQHTTIRHKGATPYDAEEDHMYECTDCGEWKDDRDGEPRVLAAGWHASDGLPEVTCPACHQRRIDEEKPMGLHDEEVPE
jgi:hypothetical protein